MRGNRRSCVLGLAVVLGFTVAPAAAAAATRYATPNPVGGADCSSPAEACSIITAVNGAATGDTIIVGSGTYGSSSSPVAGPLNGAGTAGLKIEGASGGPGRPVLNVAAGFPSNPTLLPTGVLVSGAGAELTDVDVEASVGDAVEITGGDASTLVERVIARTSGDNACDLESAGSATIANSLCVTTAPSAEDAGAIDIVGGAGTLYAVNDTAISTGGDGALGLETTANPALVATNTIAQGGQDDVYALASSVTVDHCAYQTSGTAFGGTITDEGGRVDAAPAYVNALSDLHEAASSPTIGAGTVTAVSGGETDLDGLPRLNAGQVDIGAYEIQPPTAALAVSGTLVTGQRVVFSAAGSSAYDGLTLTGYSWSFGDGGTATGLSPTHTFGQAGTYTVSLTVTDNRGATATATKQVTVAAPPPPTTPPPTTPPPTTPPPTTPPPSVVVAPRLSYLRIKPHTFEAATKGKAIIARVENGATITYRDTITAHTTLRVYRELPGVKHGHKCVARAAGSHTGRVKHCTRLVLVGSFKHHDKKGTNRLRFTGRVGGRALAPGKYTLTATARQSGRKSRTLSKSFTILPRPPSCQDHDHDGDCDAPGQI